MTKDEAEQVLARSRELRPAIEAANVAGDMETLRRLADQYHREVGLPLILPVIDHRRSSG